MASTATAGASVDGGDGGGGGGYDPELKQRRLLDAGGPIEDDETARQKMRDAEVYGKETDGTEGQFVGFEPDNVADIKFVERYDRDFEFYAIKPMGYFARKGDLRMMRWLYVNGAETRDEDITIHFPMYLAAVCGHLDCCKWLFSHGAKRDIKRSSDGLDGWGDDSIVLRLLGGFTHPLCALCDTLQAEEPDKREVSRWLILRGSLCDDDNGDLDLDRMRHSLDVLFTDSEEKSLLLKWASEQSQSRCSFSVFLMGTLSPLTYSFEELRNALLARIHSQDVVEKILENTPPDDYRLLWDGLFPRRVCPLEVFSGKIGILKLIGEYVTFVRPSEARIIFQLAEVLPFVFPHLGIGHTVSPSLDSRHRNHPDFLAAHQLKMRILLAEHFD